MKKNFELNKFNNLSYPKTVVLVTCIDKEGKTNVLTIAWHTTISSKPPLYGISLAEKRYSYELIKNSKEFAINFATIDMVNKIHFCGTKSGRNIYKIKECNFTLLPSKKINTPIIKECYSHLECKLHETYKIGDHIFVIGEVVNAIADEDSFKNDTLNNSKIQSCLYLGNNIYSAIDKTQKKF